MWVAPLLLITSLQLIHHESTIFSGTVHGDWLTLWAAAVCGVDLRLLLGDVELYSPAWEYAVPFVHGATLFQMPLLGYAGYLPFGLECLAVAGASGSEFSEAWPITALPGADSGFAAEADRRRPLIGRGHPLRVAVLSMMGTISFHDPPRRLL